MKRVIALCLAAAMLILLAASCQPTPEEPVVVQKDMEQMIEKGMTSSAPSQTDVPSQTEAPSPTTYEELCSVYGVPERYKTSITEGNLTVNCDAVMELPETGKLPMVRVEAARFSQEQVYTLFKALCGDTPMYVPPEQGNKAYYEKQILEYQQMMAETTDKNVKQNYKDTINSLQKQYETAPDEIELIRSDGTLETGRIKDDTGTLSGSTSRMYTKSAPYEENVMTFYVINDAEYEKDGVYTFLDEEGNTQIIAPESSSRVMFEREGMNSAYGPGMPGRRLADVTELSLTGGAADGCILSTTPQQARETVEALMRETGMEDMIIYSAALHTSKREPPSPEVLKHWEEMGRGSYMEDTSPERQAYVFRLLRRVNGVNVSSESGRSSVTSVEGMDYGKEWYYEWLSVAVDDNGIADLYWQAPLDVKEILTEETAIKPWSDIEDIFEKMIVIADEYDANTNKHKTVLDITRVSLSLRRIMERNSYTTGLLVPVWDFYGTFTRPEEELDGLGVSGYEDNPVLTINAIDGSVIDIGKGY